MDLGYANYFQFFLALIFVLGLIGLVAIIMRYYGLGGAIQFGRKKRAGRRRVEIVDVAPVDARRRLILVRRDDVEHLILLGAHEDILIESGITLPLEEAVPTDEVNKVIQSELKPFIAMTGDGNT
jgi:flagellar protein FliO/FliZ